MGVIKIFNRTKSKKNAQIIFSVFKNGSLKKKYGVACAPNSNFTEKYANKQQSLTCIPNRKWNIYSARIYFVLDMEVISICVVCVAK